MAFLKVFFEFKAHTDGSCVGVCNLCGLVYKDKSRSTGNFHKHLKRKHKKEYCEKKFDAIVVSESDAESESGDDVSKYDEKINQSIAMNLIVKCNLPPWIIEQEGFRQFMKVVAGKWKPCSARYLKVRIIPPIYNSLRSKINLMLGDIEYFSITIDT